MVRSVVLLLGVLGLILAVCDARMHTLDLKNDTRSVVHLKTFGFYANGTLDVHLQELILSPEKSAGQDGYMVGFSLVRSPVNGVLSYTAEDTKVCHVNRTSVEPRLLFLIDIPSLRVNMYSFGDQDNILTAVEKDSKETTRNKSGGQQPDTAQNEPGGQQPDTGVHDTRSLGTEAVTSSLVGKVNKTLTLQKIGSSYNFSFHLKFGSKSEGLYNLNFLNCHGKSSVLTQFSLKVYIVEQNPGGFLSAAEMPLPLLYICMAGLFFAAAMIWVHTLLKHRFSVFKIHWLMAALAFTKSISLVFHSINYHFINAMGHPIEGLAVMYYITHLLKGALLFITLALIGTGWAFVKYILSDKEKKVFMIVIPLQVLANVAYIIIESTEEGSSEYALWKEVLFLVDLICCGAILFPVVWSIRHLQEASNTDGKAATNLEKLKLFRHYYVMIVCYIYFTRIIAIFLKVTMPFQLQWLYEFLVEVSTFVFFVLTGYKFRPASNNPYLQLPQDEEDVETDEVVTESGALEGISKVKKTSNGRERQREFAL
ncbi:protein GPR108 isoform X2 [Brienomyrus brachyistius]|uniref:protein GPR108 isoform X2 n=1 Tax=Brienomyrus brachyistius TaxID=42636 RepID=UPI0020B3E8A9|nr:protein GPR108 isoform X2 [Brienomyrus brachyistius]